jgi:hypothetical protein
MQVSARCSRIVCNRIRNFYAHIQKLHRGAEGRHWCKAGSRRFLTGIWTKYWRYVTRYLKGLKDCLLLLIERLGDVGACSLGLACIPTQPDWHSTLTEKRTPLLLPIARASQSNSVLQKYPRNRRTITTSLPIVALFFAQLRLHEFDLGS